jgi:hypothetical protein
MGFLEEIHHTQSQGVDQLIDFLGGRRTQDARALEDTLGPVNLDHLRIVRIACIRQPKFPLDRQ